MTSGMHYTIIRGPAFMEWHAHNLLGKDILEKGKATIFGKGENPINFISARDMAKFAVIGLTRPQACDQIINAIGPENIRKNEIAKMYQRASGRYAKISHVPPFVLKIMPAILKFAKPELVQLTRMEEIIREKVAAFNKGQGG